MMMMIDKDDDYNVVLYVLFMCKLKKKIIKSSSGLFSQYE